RHPHPTTLHPSALHDALPILSPPRGRIRRLAATNRARRGAMPRIFVAVPVEESVRANIAGLRAVPAPQLRWVAEHQYHITLRFLGEIREADVDAVETAVREAISETFPAAGGDGPSPAGLELVARGVGAFPSPNLARVVWVGVEGAVAALRL